MGVQILVWRDEGCVFRVTANLPLQCLEEGNFRVEFVGRGQLLSVLSEQQTQGRGRTAGPRRGLGQLSVGDPASHCPCPQAQPRGRHFHITLETIWPKQVDGGDLSKVPCP